MGAVINISRKPGGVQPRMEGQLKNITLKDLQERPRDFEGTRVQFRAKVVERLLYDSQGSNNAIITVTGSIYDIQRNERKLKIGIQTGYAGAELFKDAKIEGTVASTKGFPEGPGGSRPDVVLKDASIGIT
jgi:hypothetical protein